jgi:hypothetical protein
MSSPLWWLLYCISSCALFLLKYKNLPDGIRGDSVAVDVAQIAVDEGAVDEKVDVEAVDVVVDVDRIRYDVVEAARSPYVVVEEA